MILTDKDENTRRNICPSATLFTKIPEETDLGLNVYLLVDRPATKPQGSRRGLEYTGWSNSLCAPDDCTVFVG